MHASTGSVRGVHGWLVRSVTRTVPGPSSPFSRRLVVMATREREGAKEDRTAGPVPAAGPWVIHPCCQPWGGTCVRSPVVRSAARTLPRKRLARAWTGTSHSASGGVSQVEPSGARAPPGTSEGRGGWYPICRVQGWRTPTIPRGPPRYVGSRARACKALAEVCTRRVDRRVWWERATGRRAAGHGKVTSTDGTGRSSARCGSTPGVAAALGPVGQCRLVQACSLYASAPPAVPWETGPPRASGRQGAMASRARRWLGRRRSLPCARDAGP